MEVRLLERRLSFPSLEIMILSKLIIVKRKGSLKFCEELEGVKIIDINLGNSFLRPWLDWLGKIHY